MRVFINRASGFIRQKTTALFIAAGHEVRGLTRSTAAAAKRQSQGATAVDGELTSFNIIKGEAGMADAVVRFSTFWQR